MSDWRLYDVEEVEVRILTCRHDTRDSTLLRFLYAMVAASLFCQYQGLLSVDMLLAGSGCSTL